MRSPPPAGPNGQISPPRELYPQRERPNDGAVGGHDDGSPEEGSIELLVIEDAFPEEADVVNQTVDG